MKRWPRESLTLSDAEARTRRSRSTSSDVLGTERQGATMNIERSLKLVLRTDALVCWIYAALLVVFSELLASELTAQENRWLTPVFYVSLGLFVAVVGCYSWWITDRWPLRARCTRFLVIIEIAWCLSCLAVLMFGSDRLSGTGQLFVIASGCGVFAFLVPEWLLYRRLDPYQGGRSDHPRSGRSVA